MPKCLCGTKFVITGLDHILLKKFQGSSCNCGGKFATSHQIKNKHNFIKFIMSSRYADDGKKKPFWKRSSRSASGRLVFETHSVKL